MNNYQSRIFAYLVVGLSLTACKSTDSFHDPSCDDVPDTITEDIPNFVDLIIDDSTLPHEGLPHGVPNSYLWATGPVSHSESIPPEYHAMVAWGQVYEDVCGNPASNTRVQIRDIQAYRLSGTGSTTISISEWAALNMSPPAGNSLICSTWKAVWRKR